MHRWVTAEEEGLDGSLELVDFGLRGQVFGVVGNQLRAETVISQLLDSVRVQHCALADFDHLSDLQHSGRLGVDSTDLDLASFAGIRGLGAGLEHPDGPKDLVYSFCVCHIQKPNCSTHEYADPESLPQQRNPAQPPDSCTNPSQDAFPQGLPEGQSHGQPE